MSKLIKTAFAAALSVGLAGAVLTQTTTQAAAWGWSGGDNTWWATEEVRSDAQPSIPGGKNKGDTNQDEFSWGWSTGDNTWW